MQNCYSEISFLFSNFISKIVGCGLCLPLLPWAPRTHSIVVKKNISSYHDEEISCWTSLKNVVLRYLFPCIPIPAYVTIFSSSPDDVELIMKHKYRKGVMKMVDDSLQDLPGERVIISV